MTRSRRRLRPGGAIVALLAAAVAAPAALAQAPASPASPVVPFDTSITLFGEVRTRGEAERAGAGGRSDAFTLLRTRVGARARLGAGTRVLVEVQDARVFGEERSTIADGAADAFDLHQGWLEIGGRWRGADVAVRAGRQEIALGNERLVGAAGWTNFGRAFDGARLLLSRPGPPAGAWQASAFGATLEERGRRYGATTPDAARRADQSLVGAFATNGTLELLAVHDRGARFRTVADVDRTTAYARLRTPAVAGVRADVEGAWQTGTQSRTVADAPAVAQDVRAWFAGARLSRELRVGVPATVTLGADWLSGDADPADGRYGAFNTLYATNHKWYGTMDLFLDPAAVTGDRGLVAAIASAAVTLSPRATLRADAHHFRLAAEHPTAGGRAIGEELDLTLPLRVSPASAVELGYSLFRPGVAGAALGLGGEGRVRHWGYAQLRASF